MGGWGSLRKNLEGEASWGTFSTKRRGEMLKKEKGNDS